MYKTKNKLFFLLAIMTLTVLAIGLMGSVSAADITINPNTAGGLKTAIAYLNENYDNGNDNIYMEDGVYSGSDNTNLNIDESFNSLNIIGKGNNVVIDAKGVSQIFRIETYKVTLKNLKLINGNSKGSGGAISTMVENHITIINCTFTNNQAGGNGGAISSQDNSFYVIGCTFTNNKANGYGGAIKGARSVSECTFTNNQAGQYGGAIYSDGTNVDNSNFNNNKATKNGGAIWIGPNADDNSVLRLDSVTFKNNMVGSKYNAIYSHPHVKVYKNNVIVIPDENPSLNDNNNNNNKLATKIAMNNFKGNHNQNIKLTATLTSSGSPISSKTVKFHVNNKQIGSAKTNTKGIATINYKILSKGKQQVKATIDADSKYQSSQKTSTLEVPQKSTLKIKNTNSVKNKKVTITSTLANTGPDKSTFDVYYKIPKEFTYVKPKVSTGKTSYDEKSRTVTWQITNLKVDKSKSATLTWTLTAKKGKYTIKPSTSKTTGLKISSNNALNISIK